jgi:hypothetical protein
MQYRNFANYEGILRRLYSCARPRIAKNSLKKQRFYLRR